MNAAILMIFPFLPRSVLQVGTYALLPRPALKKNDGGMTKQIFFRHRVIFFSSYSVTNRHERGESFVFNSSRTLHFPEAQLVSIRGTIDKRQ